MVDDNIEHEKAKGVNENVVATISHNENKYILLNKKYLKHSLNRIQNKNHGIGTYEINKFLCLALMIKHTCEYIIDVMD